jgi:transcriptional regulator with XRE-family HTH domain
MFADKIREARLQADITQEQLGAVIGMTGAAVAQWEKGRSVPRPKALKRIAEAVKKPVSFFTGKPEDDAHGALVASERVVMYSGSSEIHALQGALLRLESAQRELSEAHAAVRAAMMLMEAHG